MEKPRLFISAVTRELGSARQRIANILQRKGYEPVWQDIFGTEPGDLRDMLREKIDTCAGLIQITGDAYGAEPAEPHPDSGRCSYTQFEFLYALQQKKKTWLLLAGPDVTRDHPLSELDLPRAPHPDPAAYQSERHHLQRLYKELPEFRQHLRHTAESDLALDLATERLNDELAALRAEWQQWQQTVTTTLTHTTRRQRNLRNVAAITLAATGLGLGILLTVRQNQREAAEAQEKQSAEQKAALAAQTGTLADLTKKLDEIKLDRAASGQSFRDLTKEDLERLLAEKAAITVDELRRRITVGEQSPDAMERARALLLKGDFDATLHATAHLKETRTADLIAILGLEAQAHDGKFQYKDAHAARQKIAALIDKEKDPTNWADAQHMVAYSLYDMGKVREAEPILREVITTLDVQLGPEHPQTLASRNNLANALGEQGKNPEEEAEHRAVLAVRERVLGPEHPETLNSRNNLAIALREQGKNAESEAEHRAVLAIRERVLGPEHPDTLASRNNLAVALREQGKNAPAEAEHRAVLAVRERVLGPEHPDVLNSRNNLGITLLVQGKTVPAEAEHRAVLAMRERVLGPDHPDTLRSHFNLSLCLETLGNEQDRKGEKDAARAHWREALDHARTVQAAGAHVFGPEHPHLPQFDQQVADLEAKLKE